MSVDVVTGFLLPLVDGGTLHVGRPLRRARVTRIAQRVRDGAVAAAVLETIARRRHAVAAELLPGAPAPELDETSLRLAAAAHNLLATVHPALAAGGEHTLTRIAAEAELLAELPPPASAVEAVARHSILARMTEVRRRDWSIQLWFGRRTVLGRRPPRRLTALPWLRRVRVDSVTRSWLRDLSLPTVARSAYVRLLAASPLGDALEPLRADPPPSWARILPVLRFAPLARVVASRAVELGVARAGGALAAALLRMPAEGGRAAGAGALAEQLVFAVRFLAHLVWLEQLFVPPQSSRSQQPSTPLGAVLAAAAEIDESLVWPRDMSREGDAGRAFAARLRVFAAEARLQAPAELTAADGLLRAAWRELGVAGAGAGTAT